MDKNNLILAGALTLCMVVVLMTFYKNIYYAVRKKPTNRLVNQVLAWVFSYCATVLSWKVLGVPETFGQTFIYVFAVYVLQMVIDLRMIKRISDHFWNMKVGVPVEEDKGEKGE